MDTSGYPSLPNLTQIQVRLAANSRRVEEIADSQLCNFERLLRASAAGDWQAVAESSCHLAEADPERVGAQVVRYARKVVRELSRPRKTPRVKPPKHLVMLLDACRTANINGIQQ